MDGWYITADGRTVAGPFETRSEARKRRDELETYEVGSRYRITKECVEE